jgi:hypothetical protein
MQTRDVYGKTDTGAGRPLVVGNGIFSGGAMRVVLGVLQMIVRSSAMAVDKSTSPAISR